MTCRLTYGESAPRRLAMIMMSWELVADQVKVGARTMCECVEGVPQDAVLVDAHSDHCMGHKVLLLVFEHPSFAPVSEGADVPVLIGKFTRIVEGAPA